MVPRGPRRQRSPTPRRDGTAFGRRECDGRLVRKLAIFVERGVSGSKPLGERPDGARLLAALKAGDVVITPKLDRMFRSALNALDVLGRLKDRGVSLHMIDLGGDVTGNGISKLVFTILPAVAEAGVYSNPAARLPWASPPIRGSGTNNRQKPTAPPP